MVKIQEVNTTYEPFSLEPEYIEANRGFVARVDLGGVERFLELACGTGTVSEELLKASPSAHLNGVDYDPVQIELASKRFAELGYEVRHGFEVTDEVARGKPVLVFGTGSADELRFSAQCFDCVTIANAIHVMPDRKKFFSGVASVMRSGGRFGFNSAFYAGTYPEGTERHYYEWVKLATQYIRKLNEEREARGEERIRRIKGTTRGAFQNRWLSIDEWREVLEAHGLRVADVNERVVMLDGRCFAAVGAYGGLAEVLMSGYPVEAASTALQATAEESLEVMGVRAIPRNWLEIWAEKVGA